MIGEVAEYDYTDFQESKEAELDKRLLVKFFYKSVQDETASAAEGRPIFKELEYIDIRMPGTRDHTQRRASARDKRRFQRHYDAFKQRVELPAEGTPLMEWPQVGRTEAEELAFFNIKTVEQLAHAPDSSMSNFMKGLSLKQRAKKWLEDRELDLKLADMHAQLQARNNELADLKARLDALDKPKPKRKRRTKEEMARDAELDSGERPVEQDGSGGGAIPSS